MWIKYVGSKQRIAKKLISFFPSEIETYWEPFCGSLSVYLELCKTKTINIQEYRLSDGNKDVVGLYNAKKEDLINTYTLLYHHVGNDKSKWDDVVKLFNATKDPCLFFYLIMTSYHGLIRYNKKGGFNAAFNYICVTHPSKLRDIPDFPKVECCDFLEILSFVKPNDFIYLDPPYIGSDMNAYTGKFDLNKLFWFVDRLDRIGAKWALSFNEQLPIGKRKVLLNKGNYSFAAKGMNDWLHLSW